MAIDNVRLPVSVEEGLVGGPRFLTTIQTATSGHEQRISEWDLARIELDAAYGTQTPVQRQAVLALFQSRRGKAYPFRVKWWGDYEATDQALGTGDGSTAAFQLRKVYSDGVLSYTRTIYLPVTGTVAVSVAGVLKTETTHYTVNYSTGVVTFTGGNIPSGGQAVTATFQFDIPMRFDDDHLKLRILATEDGTVPSIPLVEVLGEQ